MIKSILLSSCVFIMCFINMAFMLVMYIQLENKNMIGLIVFGFFMYLMNYTAMKDFFEQRLFGVRRR